MKKPIKSKKTNFDIWSEACKNTDTDVVLVEQKENRAGVKLRLYKLTREVILLPSTGYNRTHLTTYVLWIGSESYLNVRDLITGLQVLNRKMKEGE